ncbi:cadherin-related family member 2 [Aulostomus maculatus]
MVTQNGTVLVTGLASQSQDMEAVLGRILLLCLIGLTHANTAPVIHDDTHFVCEDTPIGAYAFTINATDAENHPLTYYLPDPNAVYFKVVKNNGSVFVQRQLDREDTPVNKTLFKVLATDYDLNDAVALRYSIVEVFPASGTSLFSIGARNGEVRLMGPLNHTSLSTFYRLKINATDGGGRCYYNETVYHSSTAISFISVEDVPDLNPQFLNLPITVRVEENSPVGLSVFEVLAIDPDRGLGYEIIFSIEHSTEDGLFKISSDGGVISVMSSIDREVIGNEVTLTIKAVESKPDIHGVYASTTANMTINILDVNDNKPEFYKCDDSGDEPSCTIASNFTAEVFEHSGSVPINMMVKDMDQITETELSLEGADKDLFSVEPQFPLSQSKVQLLVKQRDKLDFEKTHQMILKVIAKDQGNSSFVTTATVTINIKDTNDNSPEFPQDMYKLKVAEHTPAETIIANITAEDPDTMDQGNLTYSLKPQSILSLFDVNPNTGAVYVKNQTLLDHEVRSLHSATLEARDTDGKSGSTSLEITVTDINDQPPVINRDPYVGFVQEGEQFELQIEATDADELDTPNSQIVFAIEPNMYSDNFTIDPHTGVLRNRGDLDREAVDPSLKGKIKLNVTATDMGTPPLSTMVTVIIDIGDINDNVPQFEKSSYNFSVKEGEKGALVGSVFAEDLDQTIDFNRLSFYIIDGSFGSFIIRTIAEDIGFRGNISVDPDIELDYESPRKHFKLQVEAADLEQEKAVTIVEINVLDVNDERPEFKPMAPVTVKENTTLTGGVGNFTAVDRDGHHSLIYELQSIKCRCNGTFSPCDWFILEPTGEVKVNPEQTLDYELCDQALVEAWAVDEYTEKGENSSATTGEMVINIEDINDNAPEFTHSKLLFVVVSETASKGTSVAKVNATDHDSGINAQIEFKVTGVQFENTNNQTSDMKMLFEVVTTQQKDSYIGIIQTTGGLDLKLKGKYLVTVAATDTGGLSTSTVVGIFTVDESYQVELRFTSNKAEVEKNKDNIIRVAVGAIMLAYFLYSNGTALTSTEVQSMITVPEHFVVLEQLGLLYIGSTSMTGPDADPIEYALLGMVGGLVIVLAVLTTSLVCTRRTYRRKLKAAKAMNTASLVASANQKSGPVVPGTNKYTMEGANPVLNCNIDTAMVLDLDEDSSDVDKVSLNSLDLNDDMTLSEKDTKPVMQMIQEEDDDEGNGPPEYIEPLGAALAQRGQKKGAEKPPMGFSNPIFSTTDL